MYRVFSKAPNAISLSKKERQGLPSIAFTTTSGNPFPGITRSFTSFSQAAQENADSRVFAGIHFRRTCSDGLRQGKKVGRFAFKHYLKPIRKHDSDDDDDNDN